MPKIPRLALPVIVLVAVVGYVAYWFHVAGQVPGWIDAWARDVERSGIRSSHGAVEVEGFPFRLEITVRDVAFARADARGTWTWRGPWLTALIKPWDFDRILVTLPPEHVVEREPGGSVTIAQGLNQNVLIVADGVVTVLASDARDMVLTDAQGNTATFAGVQARYERGEDDDGRPRHTYGGKLVDAVFAPPPPAGFPATIAEIAGVIHMMEPLPEGEDRAALGRWRDAGGILEVDLARLRWGALDVAADGTLALDAAFRPQGAFTARIAGYDEALAAATESGDLAMGQALALHVALDAMAKDDNGVRRTEIAVTMQDGQLYIGMVPVAAVPPLPLD